MPTFDGTIPIGWLILIQAAAFIVTFCYGSFFEHTLHRYLMHRDNLLKYPYKLHALQHHKLFRADESYHAVNEDVKQHVSFGIGEYIILPLLHLIPFVALEIYAGLPVVIGGMLAIYAYLAAFDLTHYSMHVPNTFFFEKYGFFKWLKQHHLLHHKYQDRNLNVVLPIADFVLRTRINAPLPGQTVLELESTRV